MEFVRKIIAFLRTLLRVLNIFAWGKNPKPEPTPEAETEEPAVEDSSHAEVENPGEEA